MTTSSPRRTRQKKGARSLASPGRHAASTLVAALAFALVAGATAPAAAAPTTLSAAPTAPVFDADYLDGVSGAEPAEEVNLAGTWDFTPLTNTICTGGGRFGTTTGPSSHASTPLRGGPTTIQVPGGGWVKQGWTDLSRAAYAKDDQHPRDPGRPGDAPQLRRDQPRRDGTSTGERWAPRPPPSPTRCSTSAASSRPAEHRIEVDWSRAARRWSAPTPVHVPRARRGPTTSPRASSGRRTSRSSPPSRRGHRRAHVGDRQDAQLRRARSPTARIARRTSTRGALSSWKAGLEVPGGAHPARGCRRTPRHDHGRPAAWRADEGSYW